MTDIKKITIKLPVYVCSYLFYGDDSGISAMDKKVADKYIDNLRAELNAEFIDAADMGNAYFSWNNDMTSLGGDVADYTFIYKIKTKE